jgi:hypothetical protein
MGTDLPLSTAPNGAVVRRKSRCFVILEAASIELDKGGRSARRRASYGSAGGRVNATDDVGDAR